MSVRVTFRSWGEWRGDIKEMTDTVALHSKGQGLAVRKTKNSHDKPEHKWPTHISSQGDRLLSSSHCLLPSLINLLPYDTLYFCLTEANKLHDTFVVASFSSMSAISFPLKP